MILFRLIALVLVALLYGLPVLSAQSIPVNSGDQDAELAGDVNPEPDDERDPEGSRPEGEGRSGSADGITTAKLVVHTFSLDLADHEEQKIHLALPIEMARAFAVMVAGEQGVKIPIPIVASHLEFDLQVFEKLNELSVREARIWLATDNGTLVYIDVTFDGDLNTVTFSYLSGGDGGVVILPG